MRKTGAPTLRIETARRAEHLVSHWLIIGTSGGESAIQNDATGTAHHLTNLRGFLTRRCKRAGEATQVPEGAGYIIESLRDESIHRNVAGRDTGRLTQFVDSDELGLSALIRRRSGRRPGQERLFFFEELI